MRSLILKIFPKKTELKSSSEFSRFFHKASSGEKKRVYKEVARKATEEQRAILDQNFRIS